MCTGVPVCMHKSHRTRSSILPYPLCLTLLRQGLSPWTWTSQFHRLSWKAAVPSTGVATVLGTHLACSCCCWGLNSALPVVQWSLLNTEPSLQPPMLHFPFSIMFLVHWKVSLELCVNQRFRRVLIYHPDVLVMREQGSLFFFFSKQVSL